MANFPNNPNSSGEIFGWFDGAKKTSTCLTSLRISRGIWHSPSMEFKIQNSKVIIKESKK